MARHARHSRAGSIGMRSTGCKVSGSFNAAQANTAAPKMASRPKIHGHGATSTTACPRVGASTGAPMNTIEVSDMTRAISRPA